jgi:hypothetical protein
MLTADDVPLLEHVTGWYSGSTRITHRLTSKVILPLQIVFSFHSRIIGRIYHEWSS